MIGAAGPRIDLVNGINAGLCLFDGINVEEGNDTKKPSTEGPQPMANFDFDAPASLDQFLPKITDTQAPKCVKSIALSPWNPPPHHLRQKGHLIYVQVTTLEGDNSISPHTYLGSTSTGLAVTNLIPRLNPLPKISSHTR